MHQTESIREWVYSKRIDIISDIERIVNIRSVATEEEAIKPFGKGCRKVLDEMLQISAEKGFCTENYDYYLGSVSYGEKEDNSKATLGLWGHLDVIPEGEGWDYPAYQMTQVEDFLIGRGVQDNKGPVIGLLYALKCFEELNIPRKYKIKLFFGCSEEPGMQDAEYFINNYKVPELSIVADCGFPVCYGEKGILNMELTKKNFSNRILDFKAGSSINSIPHRAQIVLNKASINLHKIQALKSEKDIEVIQDQEQITIIARGKASHVCTVEDSRNAIGILVNYLLRNEILPEETEILQVISKLSSDAYGIAGGLNEKENTIGELTGAATMIGLTQEGLKVHIDYRYPILNAGGNVADGAELINKIKELSSSAGCENEVTKHSKPSYANKENIIVRKLTETYQRVSGFDNEVFTMGGGTYARMLPNAIAFGMALPNKKIYQEKVGHGDYHQPDESLNINELLEAIVIYVESLKMLNELDIADLDLLL